MGLGMDFDKLKRHIDVEAEKFERAAYKAIERIAWEIARDAKIRTPVDTGFLRNSQKVEQRGPGEWAIVYLTSYALYVHEREELEHETGEAKFLENAFKAKAPTFNDDLIRYTEKYA